MKSFVPFFLFVAACGGVSDGTPAAIPGEPAPQPSEVDTVPASTSTVTYAISEVWLGDVTPDNPADFTTTAWRSFGFDLDGRATTESSADVCTLATDAAPVTQVDGNFGIDNNWGSQILPMLATVAGLPVVSGPVTTWLGQGAPTIEIEVTGLPDDPAASALGLGGGVFGAAKMTSGDPFDPNAARPVVASSTIDGATVASGPRFAFGSAYVSGGTFVGRGGAAPLVLEIPVSPQPLELQVHDAIVSFDRTSDPSVVTGTIAGVLDTEALVASGKATGGFLFPEMCSKPGDYDVVAQQIRQSQDILADGTNRSGTPCSGISFGIGFTAKRIPNPTEVVADPAPLDGCK